MEHFNKIKAIENTSKPLFLQNQPESLIPVAKCLKLIDILFEVRLVQHLSRPIDLELKYQLVDKFKAILVQLHERLNFLRRIPQNSCASTRSQSYRQSKDAKSTKNLNWQKHILKIQAKYNDVLIDGSFKHYSKLIKLYRLKPINLINISEWVKNCIQQIGSEKQKCC